MTKHELQTIAMRNIVESRFALTWCEHANNRALARMGGSLARHACNIKGDPLPDYHATYMEELLTMKGANLSK